MLIALFDHCVTRVVVTNHKCFILACLVLSFSSFAFADNPNNGLGQVQFSAYASTDKNEEGLFTADFIVPLIYTADKNTLFYYNPKDTYSTPDANEIHQGVGIRHIFDDSFILGVNTFFDRRQDSSDEWFSQAGVGFEYLSHPLDMRLNWYKPTTGAKTLGAPSYAFGSSDLIEYQQREEPLQGLDLEAGIPVFDKYTRTRVYAGGYFYQSRLAKDVNGFRARTETGLTKWLSLDTTFNSNIDKKVEFYGGLRVTLAFDLSNLFNKTGKPVFSSPSPPASESAYLEDRIFERVVRDIDIQSKTSTVQSDVHGMIYVNNTNTGTQNGTLQDPYDTIAQGITAAAGGKWVFVEGQGAADYAGGLNLTNGVTLWGSGYNGGFNGLAVSGVYPVINATAFFSINGVNLANANTVMGLQIETDPFNGDNGIKFTNGITQTGTITHNIMTNVDNDGIDLANNTGAMSNFTISDNTISFASSSGHDGIDLSSNTGSMSAFVISNNTVIGNSADHDGIDLDSNGNSATGTMTNFTITNNTVDNHSNDGIDLSINGALGSGTMTNFIISDNTADGNRDGIDLLTNGLTGNGTMTDFVISNNTLNNNSYDGLGLAFNGISFGHGTMTDFTITNNTVESNLNDGIDLSNNGSLGSGTLANFTISDNTSDGNQSDGIDLSYNGFHGVGTLSNFTISNNTSNGNQSDGIDLSYNGNSGGAATTADLTFSYNNINSNSKNGIDLSNNSGTFSGINLGNGIAGGYNSIYGNNVSNAGYFDINNGSYINDLPAEYNWWGQAGGPVAGQIGGSYSVDSSHPLIEP